MAIKTATVTMFALVVLAMLGSWQVSAVQGTAAVQARKLRGSDDGCDKDWHKDDHGDCYKDNKDDKGRDCREYHYGGKVVYKYPDNDCHDYYYNDKTHDGKECRVYGGEHEKKSYRCYDDKEKKWYECDHDDDHGDGHDDDGHNDDKNKNKGHDDDKNKGHDDDKNKGHDDDKNKGHDDDKNKGHGNDDNHGKHCRYYYDSCKKVHYCQDDKGVWSVA